jgi:hypothetical protein
LNIKDFWRLFTTFAQAMALSLSPSQRFWATLAVLPPKRILTLGVPSPAASSATSRISHGAFGRWRFSPSRSPAAKSGANGEKIGSGGFEAQMDMINECPTAVSRIIA